jgi:amino acid adenylation domain-containing protein
VGRADQQVKIRGQRVELGEIEAALAAHPAIAGAAVVARDDLGSGLRLVAYVVPADPASVYVVPADPSSVPANSSGGLDDAGLREFLRAKLPEAMVPAAYVALDRLPLSATGKLDRKALAALPAPAPPAASTAAGAVGEEEPRTPAEALVAGIFADLLGRPRVGRGESFFDLGGHSLLATRVTARLHAATGVDVPLRALFEAPTAAGLAAQLGDQLVSAPEAAIPPADRGRPLPLSFAQERVWFLAQLDPASTAYNLPAALRLGGDLEVPALAAALTALVRRHEALRTTFVVGPAGPEQRIADPAPVPLPVLDLAGPDARETQERARARFAAVAATPFDLARGPLLRLELLRLGAREHLLIVDQHHAITDGWSIGLLVRELGALYAAARAGAPDPERLLALLPPLPVQYADYAVWQRGRLAGEDLERQVGWWRGQLAGIPEVLALPVDRPRPAVQTLAGGEVAAALPAALAGDLAALARRHGATLFMALLAAFQALLARCLPPGTAPADGPFVPVGSPVAGRTRVELEGMIGFFANTLVLRGDLRGEPGFGALLARTREATLGAFAHQEVPFEKLVEALQPRRSLAHAPLVQVLLALQNTAAAPLELPGLTISRLAEETPAAPFDLALHLAETAGGADGSDRADRAVGIAGRLVYARDLFDRPSAIRLAQRLRTLVAAAVASPDLSWRDLDLLAPAERLQLLAEWSGAGEELRVEEGTTLARLVAAQAARTPAATALVVGGERLTYGELAARVEALAGRLQGLGVGPEERVAVCVGRSAALVVALLAVLEAGGAYVPIDPAYPRERRLLMLADARPAVLLTEEPLLAEVAAAGVPALLVDREAPAQSPAPTGAPAVAAASAALPDNLAYFIYTSGSTGRPKGVAVTHRSAAALVLWALASYASEELAGVLFATSICFDLSVFELFVPLASGGTVILAENALELPALPARSEVTLVNTVPSAIAELVRAGSLPVSVRTVNLAGEALRQGLVDRLYLESGVRRVWNLYGPSEDTTYSTAALTAAGADRVAIGRPLPGSRAYVLDSRGRPAPAGVPGELFLGGIGLARGYFDRPELTAERFVPEPGRTGARLYRTGDLVRFLPDGALEFLGRIDHQVKVRGFRIELGEIESALAAHPGVREVVVLAREDRQGEDGPDLRLVAYVAGTASGMASGTASDGELRRYLGDRLPAYMVPATFVTLEALPLTPNGKVDRRALPAPEATAPGADFEPPGTELEMALAEVWREVLGSERIGIHENFFDLGGHSLLGTRMLMRVRDLFGVDISLRRFFEDPTLAGLSLALAEALMGDLEEERASELFAEIAVSEIAAASREHVRRGGKP